MPNSTFAAALPADARLVSRTRALPLSPDAAARLDLLALLPEGEVTSWVRRGEGLVSWGEVARFQGGGAERFDALAAQWQELAGAAEVEDAVQVYGSGPVAFGSFAFSRHSAQQSVLLVPQIVIGRRDGVVWETVQYLAGQPAPDSGLDLVNAAVQRAQQGASSLPDDAPQVAPALESPLLSDEAVPSAASAEDELPVTYAWGALNAEEWKGAVEAGLERIKSGEVAKVVLARDVVATANEPFSQRKLLRSLNARYDSTWTFAVAGLIGATPELLVRVNRGLVTSRVLAGTIRTKEADLDQAAQLLSGSTKDVIEHEYAVNSVAAALAPFTSSMNVPDQPFVLTLPNVLHLATDVTAVLNRTDGAGPSSLTLAAALHPSAAVCGTPTDLAAQVIAELEQMDRGRYAGPVGWLGSNGDGEWGIALRCGQLDAADPTRIQLFAGCGVVAGSDPAEELEESEAKLIPMREAVTAAAG